MYFKLFSRSKIFSFKAFGQVTSRHQVVQKEMKKNAFLLFSKSKNFFLKHLVRLNSSFFDASDLLDSDLITWCKKHISDAFNFLS
jgi:hypothetical protein